MKSISKLSKAAFLSLSVSMVVFFASAVTAPRPAKAQLAVVCANCSQLTQQILNYIRQGLQYAKQLDQYAKQIESYILQIKQFENMVKNSVQLPQMIFDDALSTIRSIESTMQQAKNIGYTWSNLDFSFKSMFPDTYSQYNRLKQFGSSWDRLQDDFHRSERTYDSALSALKAAREQSQDLARDQYRMDRVGWQLGGAQGRLDALQAAGEYAQHSAQQLMKLRQIGLLQIQLMAQVQADTQERLDMDRAAQQIWIENEPDQPINTGFSSSRMFPNGN